MFIIRWIIGILLTIVAAVFAVLNRYDVDVYWNPIGDESISLPVYVLVLGAMAAGFIIGGFIVWLNSSPIRSERRKQKKEIKALKAEIAKLQDDCFTNDNDGERKCVSSVTALSVVK